MFPLKADFTANRTATKEAAGPKSLKRLEENKGGREREEGGKTEKKRGRRQKMNRRKRKMMEVGFTFLRFPPNG